MDTSVDLMPILLVAVIMSVGMLLGAYASHQFYARKPASISVVRRPETNGDVPQWVHVTCPDGWDFQGPEDALYREDVLALLREHGVEIIGRKA